MPGRSSAAKEEPNRVGAPLPLLEAMGRAVGHASQDDSVVDPTMGSMGNTPTTASIAEGACRQKKYSLLVRIFTARDRWALEPHHWLRTCWKTSSSRHWESICQWLYWVQLSASSSVATALRVRACLGTSHSTMPTNSWAYTPGLATP